MSVLQLGNVYSRARTFLNDDEATNWTDYKLYPKLVAAFDEMQAELILAGIPIIHAISIILTIPPVYVDDNNLDMSTVNNYPTDMLLPIWMKERQVGDTNCEFVDMVECDFVPNVTLDIYLRYWVWFQNTIMLRGALNPVQVQLRYQRFLPIPGVNTDSIIVPLAQLFLAPRVAALAFDSAGQRQQRIDLTNMAKENLDKIVRLNIKELQDLPAKRRPYHRGYGRNGILRDW